MSGHSKWSTIKRKKGAADAKRGQLFTKIAREIAIAAREGGPDPESNFKLRLVIEKARTNNMPKENTERAIRRGAGLGKGDDALDEMTYEGYGPGGVALLVQVVTDNKNRAVAEVRRYFTKHNGNLGESGCVSWLFSPKGVITLSADDINPDTIFEIAVEAGAEDVQIDDVVEIYTASEDFQNVRITLEEAGIRMESASISMIPSTYAEIDEKTAIQVLRLIENLEDLDDVQNVYSNLDISEDLLERYEAA